jgi:ABC-2 type transport system permease protein
VTTTQLSPGPAHTSSPELVEPSAAQIIQLIAVREITTKLRDKAFLISSAVLLAIVAASIGVPLFLERNSDQPEFTLAVAGQQANATGQAARQLGQQAIDLAQRQQAEKDSGALFQPGPAVRSGQAAAPPARLTVTSVPDAAAAQRLLSTGDADAALIPGDSGRLTLVGDTEVKDDLARLVTIAIANRSVQAAAQDAGIDPAEAATLVNVQPPPVRLLDPPAPNSDIATGLGIAFSVLFFFTAFTYGLLIAQSVVEEKQSRVVELLVAAVPVRLILTGKVLGTTALALGQVVLLLAVGLAATASAGQAAAVSLLLHSGGWFLLFFVLGFTMLACLWAAAGAISARQEDLQSTTAPLQVLLMVPFFASAYVTSPGGWLTALSYFPLSAPLSMPRRLLLGDAHWWEPLLATAGILATGAVLVLIATRLYENSLLRTGSKTSLRAAWSREPSGQHVATAGSDSA